MLWIRKRNRLASLKFVAPTARSWTGPETDGVREDVRSRSICARLQAGRMAQAKAAWTGGQPLQAEGNKEDGGSKQKNSDEEHNTSR